MVKWVGVFLNNELMFGSPYSYENSLDALDYAKELTVESGELHEVKIYEKE